MTNAIFIPITQKQIEGEAVQTVDARALHTFLGVKTPFKQWIERRISDYTFLFNRDFWEFSGKKTFGIFSKEATEYALS
ncbi:antA/AntB antirepressor family protein [Candidatus Tokpelaia sp.]|uniref:antA/AntB antirepressor family protein n=1 Tax=Candidatus Tokpelaia sp. TaxID=2233777 RepID=UPI001AEEB34D|nr:antA/AntB antirepressor family protein [Candidatus Tokpelaia sp.]